MREEVSTVDYRSNHPLSMLNQEIDPIYAVTAEDADSGDLFLPELCSIDTYAEERLLGSYQRAIADAVESRSVPVRRSTDQVPYPTEFAVTSSWLKRLECFRKEESQSVFHLDAIMVAEIDVFQDVLGERKHDHARQWYRVRGQMDLTGRKTDLIQQITVYSPKDKRRGRGLDECLIPVIPKSEMEREAERILEKHGMGTFVTDTGRVEGRELARRMGLTVVPVRLSKASRIRGELYLHDTYVRVYQEDGMPDYIEVKAGTILYDPIACRTAERIEETIIHECIHYELHWLFYRLQREYNDCIQFMACMDRRYAEDSPEDAYEQWLEDESFMPVQNRTGAERSGVAWAEWQARELTPRLMMPEMQTRKKIEELSRRYRLFPGEPAITVYERLIPALARFYGVSWTAARIRMLELGCTEAAGVLNYVDGAYVPAYRTSSGVIEPGTSYVISAAELVELYHSDEQFREAMDSGRYCYAESHVCLNDPRYLTIQDDLSRLTDRSRAHIEKCCMLFRVARRQRGVGYDKNALHSDERMGDPIAVALASLPLDVFMGAADQLMADCKKLPKSLGPTLAYHREKKGLSQEAFAELLGCDPRTIRRLEKEEGGIPSRELLGFIGVSLKLPGVYTEDLMNKAGKPLLWNVKEDMELKFVLYYMNQRPLAEINKVLTSHQCRPLCYQKKRTAAGTS